MVSVVAKSFDWGKLYRDVQGMAQIPGTSSVHDSGSQFVFRDMLVELDDVLDAVTRASSPPLVVFVYADVVRLPTERNWLLDNLGLFIAARRIDAQTGTFFQLDCRDGKSKAQFVLYATEIEGPLAVRVFTSPDPQQMPTTYDLSQFDALGVRIACRDGAPNWKDLTYVGEETLELGKDLWMSLSSTFQFAAVLLDRQPNVAGAMLRWIKACTAPSTVARDLYLQSSALLSQLTLSSSQVSFVPYLSQKVYEDLARGFQAAAVQYEAQYQIFRQEKEDKQRWIDAANQMQHHYQLTGEFHQQLIDQANDNLNSAQQAVDEATRRLKWQKLMVEREASLFSAEIEIWKRDQILKAVFSICTALVEFAAAVAMMAVGDEAAGASAAGAVAEAGKAAGEAAKVGGKAAEMSQTMADLAKAMSTLKEIGEALQKTYGFIAKVAKAAENIKGASAFDDLTMPSEDDISCQAEWDAFRLEVDSMLKDVVDEGVDGAVKYNTELDKLSVYGKALSATQSSLIQAAQELAQLYMQKHVSDAMQDSLDNYIERLEQDIEPDEAMMQLLHVRLLNIKRWMHVAIRNYTRAYRYWALRESVVTPSIVKTVPELEEDLARIKQDYADALGAFSPPPQEFGIQGREKVFEITDESVLAEFRKNGEAHIVVPPDAETFRGFDRVRLARVRVWLYGVKAREPLYIEITNSGAYHDRFKGKRFRFTSSPLERRFQYSGRPGQKSGIEVDGSVADEEKYAYFQPTPFSEWSISLPPKLNPDVDLSGLTKITMAFAGSVIGGEVRNQQ